MECSGFPEVSCSNCDNLFPHAGFAGQGRRLLSHQEARVCITLPHLFPSVAVPVLLGLEAGSLSPGVDEPPEGTRLVRDPLVVVAGPPPWWPSPEFSLLKYSEEEWVNEPLWPRAVEEVSVLYRFIPTGFSRHSSAVAALAKE